MTTKIWIAALLVATLFAAGYLISMNLASHRIKHLTELEARSARLNDYCAIVINDVQTTYDVAKKGDQAALNMWDSLTSLDNLALRPCLTPYVRFDNCANHDLNCVVTWSSQALTLLQHAADNP